MSAMSGKSNFLDFDPSSLENRLRFVKNDFEDEFNSFLKEPNKQIEPQLPFKIIKPEPGFCVKVLRQIDNDKIFINICQSNGIPAPDDITTNQLTEMLHSDRASSFRVPMSISELRPIKDKSGKNATACDVAINTRFFIKVERIELFRDFLLTIIFEALDTKYNITVDQTSWTILKKKSMGELISHRIQNRDVKTVIDSYQTNTSIDDSLSLREELNGSGGSAKKSKPLIEEITNRSSTGNLVNKTRKSMEYRLIINNEHVIAEFHLPLVQSLNEMFLVVGVDCIRFAAVKHGYFVNEYIRQRVDPDRAKAEFQKNTKILRITMPIVKES